MHVAVFGGGYAGIVAVKRLERRLSETVRIELVDPRETHLVKHKLHRLVRRPALRDDLEIPFEEILDRTEWRQDAVEAIHPDAGRAELRSGTELAYDAGIVAFGATPDFFGMDDVRRRAIPLDTPAQAIRIGEATRSLLEDGSGSIVVGGGGLAGVQLAGELAAIVRAADGEDITIELIEQEPRIVPQESKQFAEALSNALEEAGVRIRTGTSVVGADESGVEIEPAEVRPADLFVWTGGIRGRMATEKKRYTVRADLRVGKRTYGSGDAVGVIDVNGDAVAPTAQAAVRTGKVAADNVIRRLESGNDGFSPAPVRYRNEDAGRIASVGDRTIAEIGPTILTGPAAKALKSLVGSRYLGTAGAIEEAVGAIRTAFD